MPDLKVPNPIIAVVSEVIASHFTHSQIDCVFQEKGAPGEPPLGNKVDKCSAWLKRCNNDPGVDVLSVLGGVLENFMEVDPSDFSIYAQDLKANRHRVLLILSKYGLSYHPGGKIYSNSASSPLKTLHDLLKCRDVPGISVELDRALNTVESDPPSTITAACAAVEALCKTYIEEEGLTFPTDKSMKPLWKLISNHIGFDPSKQADEDIRRVLSGITSIVDGIGALRTHVGSAHGHGNKHYKVEPRHARLAMNAATTIVTFVIETWQQRKKIHSNL